MNITLDDPRWHKVPLTQIISIPESGGIFNCYTNFYWAVTPDDEVLFFRRPFTSPQCNRNKMIVEKCAPAGCRVEFIERAFIKHTCEC